MNTSRPKIAAWGLAAGMLWVLTGPATAGAETGDPAGLRATLTLYELAPEAPALEQASTRALVQGADPDLMTSLLRRAHQEEIPGAVLLPWVERVERVATSGLPTSPVISRYLEGIAKAVSPARIDAAVDMLENRLQLAARRVDSAYPAPTTAAAAHARLVAIDHAAYTLGLPGVTEAHLDRSIALAITGDSSINELQSPVLTLGILVASGIQPERSLEVVSVAWDHGYRGNDLERLGKAVGRLRNDGASPPADVVKAVLEMIGNDVSREEVFKGLDDLNDREDYIVPGLAPGDDPTIRRGDTRRDLDPPAGSAPKDPAQPKPVGGRF